MRAFPPTRPTCYVSVSRSWLGRQLMGFSLGIDVGAGTCAAATGREGALEPLPLGDRGTTMPTAALHGAEGTVLVGEAADRRSRYEPTLVARMVSTRLDDPDPIVVDGTPCDPLALTEAIIAAVVDRCVATMGAPPDHVVVTYPLDRS